MWLWIRINSVWIFSLNLESFNFNKNAISMPPCKIKSLMSDTKSCLISTCTVAGSSFWLSWNMTEFSECLQILFKSILMHFYQLIIWVIKNDLRVLLGFALADECGYNFVRIVIILFRLCAKNCTQYRAHLI